MQASIFISKYLSSPRTLLLKGLSLGVVSLLLSAAALADDTGGRRDRSAPPEKDDDFTSTPFTEYGAFNEDADEDSETRFMQYGRLFGVSLGAGNEGASGNRGQYWQGGFPMLELKVHYWFDFQLAMDILFTTASHTHAVYQGSDGTTMNTATTRIGVDVKYYFDVKNMSAPISFCNPYILGGVGSFSKTESNPANSGDNSSDTALYLSGGLGLEFPIKPRKAAFELEARVINATFPDTGQPVQGTGLADLSGLFYSLSGSFLFTW